jgi:dihydroorotase
MEIMRDGGTPVKIVMRKPADMHQHLRQDALLELVAPMVEKRFGMAVVMPNTVPPITTYEQIRDYWCKVKSAAPNLKALMTFFLTDTLESKDVAEALSTKLACGVKYYPPGLTTNSDKGVKNPASLWTKGTKPYEVLCVLASWGGVLLIHAADGIDKNRDELDPYDQEKHFIRETLPRILDAHAGLKISIEHLSTKEGAQFIERNNSHRLGCSLTAHHLLLDRRDVFRGGFHPHRSWMPVIQPREHKEALQDLAKKGLSSVWLGSDSAPHPRDKKEAPCCASGVLMAHAGIELYVEAFEDMGCLDKLENFASINGPTFFGVEASTDTISLVREEWKVKSYFVAEYASGGGFTTIVPFRFGEKVRWKLVD